MRTINLVCFHQVWNADKRTLTLLFVLAKSLARTEGATRDRPFGPWVPQDIEDFRFATVTSRDDVPRVLHLAQLATLNPGKAPGDFQPGREDALSDYQQVKFSPNVIRLDISGPELPNLSFYDLPGVINNADVVEETYLVKLVKNLVKEYVSSYDSINLLALPMTDDVANSSALSLIKELKAEDRTVGCLTKPDRRQEGESMDQWIKILNGERYVLGHGYYVIKNNASPAVNHATARAEEASFFESEPWATSLNYHSDRFGTLSLQTALSRLLTAQIQKRSGRSLVLMKSKQLNLYDQSASNPDSSPRKIRKHRS